MSDADRSAAEDRARLVRDGFARLAACEDEAAYDEALTALADAIAADGAALARELAARAATPGAWQRMFIRVFEFVDGQRMMGRISDKDELYRIAVTGRRLAARAHELLDEGRAIDDVFDDLKRDADRLLFHLGPATPPGRPLPPAVADDGLSIDQATLTAGFSRTAVTDRIHEAVARWEGTVAPMAAEQREQLASSLRLDRKEHKRYVQLAEWGERASLLTVEERDGLVGMLGRFDKDAGGWPEGTPLAARAAAAEAVASLHDLFASLSEG